MKTGNISAAKIQLALFDITKVLVVKMLFALSIQYYGLS